jgi:hypothetical protein
MASIEACVHGTVAPGLHVLGASGIDSVALLRRTIELGVRLQEFTGVARATAW